MFFARTGTGAAGPGVDTKMRGGLGSVFRACLDDKRAGPGEAVAAHEEVRRVLRRLCSLLPRFQRRGRCARTARSPLAIDSRIQDVPGGHLDAVHRHAKTSGRRRRGRRRFHADVEPLPSREDARFGRHDPDCRLRARHGCHPAHEPHEHHASNELTHAPSADRRSQYQKIPQGELCPSENRPGRGTAVGSENSCNRAASSANVRQTT